MHDNGENELSVALDRKLLSILNKLPGVNRAGRLVANIDARVIDYFIRCDRYIVTLKIQLARS